MKILQCVLLSSLIIFASACNDRKREIESLQQDKAKLNSELEKLLGEQKLIQTNFELLREVAKEQKEKVSQREEELNRLREAFTNLVAQLAEAKKESDEAKKENEEKKKEMARLQDSRNQQAIQQEKIQQTQKMKALVGKILAKLDRVLQENPRYSTATLKSDLSDEENRLKSLANSQKSEIGELIAELEALGFQDKRNLDSLISSFVFKYGLYASYCRMSWSALLVRGEKDEDLWSKMNGFQTECFDIRKKVSELKY